MSLWTPGGEHEVPGSGPEAPTLREAEDDLGDCFPAATECDFDRVGIEPGGSVSFRAEAFDAAGLPLGPAKASWKVEGLDACARCRWPVASRWRFCAWCGKKNAGAMVVAVGRNRR